ncbi:MAG: carbamoyl phosphate synthase large subunit, partial [Ilumatobacteraceae bacterium]
MGIDSTFGRAFVKAETAAGTELPTSGMVFLTLNDRDKASAPIIAKGLRQLGLGLMATSGTAEYLAKFGYSVDRIVGKVSEQVPGSESQWHNDAVELLKQGEITFVINTPSGGRTRTDGEAIRKAANMYRVSSVTTIKAALAAVQGLAEAQQNPLEVRSLQEYHGR